MAVDIVLQAGDVCTMKEDEQDIELFYAGTQVTLTTQNGSYWYCEGMVNGIKKSLLIFAGNLELVPN